MRIIFAVFILLLIFSLFVFASRDPVPGYCTLMGYSYEVNDSDINDVQRDCIFDSGHRCNAHEFYSGACGNEFVKTIPCASEGQARWLIQDCCEGLYPYNGFFLWHQTGDPTCTKFSFFQKILYWIDRAF